MSRPDRVAASMAALAALATLLVGVVWGAWIAGGSDSYCYVEQAERWAAGTMLSPQPVGFDPPWPDPWLPLAPTGFVPSRTIPGALAPICPSGLSLTMAPLRWAAGRDAVFVVVPVLGALAVWLAFLIGSQIAGRAAGLLAAVLLATSPIFLFQLVQPMSDVPATAWWLLALWLVLRASPLTPTLSPQAGSGGLEARSASEASSPSPAIPLLAGRGSGAARRTSTGDDRMPPLRACGERVGVRGRRSLLILAGLATSAAVLTRPVLAPVAGVLCAGLVLRPRAEPLRQRLQQAVWFGLGGAPGAIALGLLQQALYGSPFSSGYGSPSDLFAAANIGPNAGRYARWAVETQTPFLLLAPAALWLAGRRGVAALLLAIIAAVTASYLPYTVFDDWSYLRFLLPAVAPALVLAAAVAATLATRLPRRAATAALVGLAIAVGAWGVQTARDRYVFALHASEAKFRIAGEYVARALPPSAVVLTIWHSGSVRYYGHRLSVLWDGFPAESLESTIAFLQARGYHPFLLLEGAEEARFRARFAGHSPLAALDWPPVAMFGRGLRLYRLADRRVYFEGGRVPTEYLPLR